MKSTGFCKTLIAIIVLFSAYNSGNAQNSATDSIENIIKAEKKDTSEVIAMTDLANLYVKVGRGEEGLKYCEKAIDLAQKLKFTRGEILGNYYAAKCCIYLSENAKGITFCDRVIVLTDKIDPEKVRASAFIIKGNILMREGNYTKAMEALYSSLSASEKIKDTIGIINTRSVIGNVYSKLSENEKALEQYHFCRYMAARVNYKNGIAAAFINIGNLYGNLGQPDSAIVYLKKSLPVLLERNNKFNLSVVYGGLAVNYNGLKKFDTAKKYIKQTIQIKKEIGHTEGLIDSYLTLTEIFQKSGDYKSAKLYADSVEALLMENPSKVSERDLRNVLYSMYKEMGDVSKALVNYEVYVRINNELLGEESRKEIQRREIQFEFEKKEAESKMLREKEELKAREEKQKQQMIIYVVSAGFVMVLILLIVIIRSLRINKRKNKIISEQKNIVEEKQKEIIDSIKYAKRIQMSLLASEKYIQKSIEKLMGNKS